MSRTFFLICWIVFLALGSADILRAQTVYNCGAPENREKPTIVEVVLSKKWKDRVEEVKRSFTEGRESMKVRVKIFPFLDPPANMGIGKCVSAEEARLAIREAIAYNRGIDRLIMQEILPHHWIKIGSTDLAEISWIPVSPEDLARLSDPALSTDQFQNLYRRLATMKEKKLPFGMGSEKREESR